MELLSRCHTVAEKKQKDKNIAGYIPAFFSRHCQWGGRCKEEQNYFHLQSLRSRTIIISHIFHQCVLLNFSTISFLHLLRLPL